MVPFLALIPVGIAAGFTWWSWKHAQPALPAPPTPIPGGPAAPAAPAGATSTVMAVTPSGAVPVAATAPNLATINSHPLVAPVLQSLKDSEQAATAAQIQADQVKQAADHVISTAQSPEEAQVAIDAARKAQADADAALNLVTYNKFVADAMQNAAVQQTAPAPLTAEETKEGAPHAIPIASGSTELVPGQEYLLALTINPSAYPAPDYLPKGLNEPALISGKIVEVVNAAGLQTYTPPTANDQQNPSYAGNCLPAVFLTQAKWLGGDASKLAMPYFIAVNIQPIANVLNG